MGAGQGCINPVHIKQKANWHKNTIARMTKEANTVPFSLIVTMYLANFHCTR